MKRRVKHEYLKFLKELFLYFVRFYRVLIYFKGYEKYSKLQHNL